MARSKPMRLFYSYSSKDERYMDELEANLSLLKYNKLISGWEMRKVTAGEKWDKRVKEELDEADVIILLVSTHFLASKYIWTVEFKHALKRHREGTALVIPVILSDSMWRDTPLKKIEVLPRGDKPVLRWSSRPTAWVTVAQGIRDAILKMAGAKKTTEAATTRRSKPLKTRSTRSARSAMLSRLARDYERVRARMTPGDDRTIRMEGVYADMLRVANRINENGSREELLAKLSKSDSAGERLSAIAMLEDEPHLSYIRWLGTRFDVEAPFVGYHAATAIRAAVGTLDDPVAHKALQNAIDHAFRVLGPDRASTDRAAVLLDAQSRLSSRRRTRRR